MDGMFELAGGTVPGRDHVGRGGLLLGRNGQDAFAWVSTEAFQAAVVCDGCGAENGSEVGAWVGARLVIERLRVRIEPPGRGVVNATPTTAAARAVASPAAATPTPGAPAIEGLLEAVRLDVLGRIGDLASAMGPYRDEILRCHFLFGILGFLAVGEHVAVFAIGDGLYSVNERLERLGPFPGNAPPYLAYGLLRPSTLAPSFREPRFSIVETLPTASVDTLLLGTDGAAALVAAAARPIPGRDEPVGPLGQFFDDRFFRNPDAVRRRLALINSQAYRPDGAGVDVEHGLLADDTTIVAARRKSVAGGGVS